ncbi:tetratricopeptide repeat protein [Acinetobacter tianfuensis]|uniref:Tetratricopeptide repeat protein n=1 Tax=Acinetobacter tianfuensis TaxID=2419603 RepID=A0A3A8EAX7_9GAMM|nr:tetratricopeptide repeat protein [Acinetobacter tianfuensis]RKG31329.1 tetratricopeptide repeat protein [Acinetobacter tianfuensis]
MDLQQAQNLFIEATEAKNNNEFEKAISLYSQIPENFDEIKLIYAKAQWFLGYLFEQLDRLEEAEQAFKNVKHEDSANLYAETQLSLGFLFRQLIRPEEAEQAFRNVKHTDSAKEYAAAQWFLGVLFTEQNRWEEAEHAYNTVKHEDSVDFYAQAQRSLGFLFERQGRLVEAECAYKKVKREDSAKIYAQAQWFMGLLFKQQQRLNEAEQAYKNVKYEDSVEQYAKAQWYLGHLFESQNKIKEARECWNRIPLEDTETYAEAQLVLATKCLNENDTTEKIEYLIQYLPNIPKESRVYKLGGYQIEIWLSILKKVNEGFKIGFIEISESVDDLLKKLYLTSKYENCIAHYTNLAVSKLLISENGEHKNLKGLSALRLNTINLMNDPTEGFLLNELLCLDKNVTTEDSTFISCFTLHHDSLNQFRLYGKKDQLEATGLSLVLSKEFFAQEHNIAQMINKAESKALNNEEQLKIEKENHRLPKMPIYRCIYLDPTSGLIKVAQREEWSFHREYKADAKQHLLDKNPEAEQAWSEYQREITQIETKVQHGLNKLVKQITKLNQQKLSLDEQELLAEILLPLRYLIKHMAFKEEQECRMIYVTSMDNPLIQYDEKINRIYIDYESSVMEHLEKIYLAPKAKDEQMVFEYLCSRGQTVRKGKPPVKVKISQNPFR